MPEKDPLPPTMRLWSVPFLWGMVCDVEVGVAHEIERVVEFDGPGTQLCGGGGGGSIGGGPARHRVGGLADRHPRVGSRDHVHRLHLGGRQ